jgi:hypothetical protein
MTVEHIGRRVRNGSADRNGRGLRGHIGDGVKHRHGRALRRPIEIDQTSGSSSALQHAAHPLSVGRLTPKKHLLDTLENPWV